MQRSWIVALGALLALALLIAVLLEDSGDPPRPVAVSPLGPAAQSSPLEPSARVEIQGGSTEVDAQESETRTQASSASQLGSSHRRGGLSGSLLGLGHPLAGAELELRAGNGTLLARARTDAGGHFQINSSETFEDALLCSKVPGFAALELGPLRLGPEEQRYLGKLTLDPGLPLRGLVVDAREQPVSGARLSVQSAASGRAMARAAQTAETDAQGRFELIDAPRGVLRIEARAAGHGARVLEGYVLPSQELARIVLAAEYGLDLLVRDQAGQIVAGAVVVATAPTRLDPELEALCDAAGVAHLRGLGSQVWNLRASAPGFVPESRSLVRAGLLAEGPPPQERIVLAPWPCVRGTFYAAEGSALPAGGVAIAYAADAQGQRNALLASQPQPLDPDGNFLICDLRPGYYVIEGRVPGLAPACSTPLLLRLGDSAPRVEMRLFVGGSCAGRVSGSQHWLADIEVELWTLPPGRLELQTSARAPVPGVQRPLALARTDEQGAFRFEHLPRGSVWLLPRSPDHPLRVFGPYTAEDGQDLELGALELPVGAVLSGQVLNAAGVPAPGAQVLLSSLAETRGPQAVSCDAQGRWRAPVLLPGTWTVTARPGLNLGDAREAARGGSKPIEVVLAAGEQRALELRLP